MSSNEGASDKASVGAVTEDVPTDYPDMPETGVLLKKVGLFGTAAWILVIGLYAYGARSTFSAIAPNEFGDFLAGAFAPLAFFWLVLGFLQQGAELRNSGKALWLQGRELQNSVTQQRELVKAARDQIKVETDRMATEAERLAEERRQRHKAAEPRLEFAIGHTFAPPNRKDGSCTITLANHGRGCGGLRVNVDGYEQYHSALFASGDRTHFEIEFDDRPTSAKIEVKYLNELGDAGEAAYLLKLDEDANANLTRLPS